MYSYKKGYKNSRSKGIISTFVLLAIVIFLLFGVFKVTLAFPSVYGTGKIEGLNFIEQPQMPWPGYGQSAVGVDGYGVISSTNNQKPAPIASVTKIVTALALQQKKNLKPGEQGERITFNNQDQIIYDNYLLKQGVVVQLESGQEISQYKAMQYMLILSANNIADKLVIWAFGSLSEYKTYANNMLKEYGFETLQVDDASGFSPNSKGTAEDLIKLGDIAMDDPLIAEIVSTDYVDLPTGEERLNTNPFLNYQNNGVIGIKNGLTDEAGGVLLAATKRQVDGSEATILTAVMGSQNFFDSQKDAVTLVDPTVKALAQPAVIKKGTKIGYYRLPWGGEVDVLTTSDINLNKWSNAVSKSYVNLYPILQPKKAGDIVGNIEITANDGSKGYSEVELSQAVELPSLEWRIKNPIR